MIEIEKKFLINKKTFFTMFQSALATNRVGVDSIDQIYLFKSNSVIGFDLNESAFVVKIFDKDTKQSEFLQVPVTNKKVLKHIEQVIALGRFKLENGLYKLKGTYRIRFLNGEPIFTFKCKVPESTIGQLELEEIVTLPDAFKELLETFKSRIVKIRYNINVNHYIYEVDFYQDFDFITLEVEFKTEDEYKKFKPDFEFLMDASNDSSFKNKKLAKILLKQKG